MARVLSLDLSSKAGWSVLDTDQPFAADATVTLVAFGQLTLPTTIDKLGPAYPWNYHLAGRKIAEQAEELSRQYRVDYIAIEETNLGKQRYAQKALEFIHFAVLDKLSSEWAWSPARLAYITTSEWRSFLGVKLSAADKVNNKRLKAAKEDAAVTGKTVDKKALGVKGKVGTKQLSVRWVNENFGTDFKMKDNDITDAICVGTAFLRGAKWCDGK